MAAEMKALQDQHQRELEDCNKETQRKCEGKSQHFLPPLSTGIKPKRQPSDTLKHFAVLHI